MSLLPANVGTGHVTGVFVNSDGQAETGKVWLRPRFTSAKITTAVPPTTVLPTPRSVQIGEDGQLAETEVVATSDPDLGLEAWTYEVTFKFDSGVSYGPFDIQVPEGETIDLTLVAPAATANGVQTIRGFGVPDPADAEDGDVVSYDATAGATTWWSRSQAIGQAVAEEYEDPDSPLRASIDAAAARVADEALETRLSRTDRTRHAPALGLYFPEAEDGDIQTAWAAAGSAGVLELGPADYPIKGTIHPPAGGTITGHPGVSRIVATQKVSRILDMTGGVSIRNVSVVANGNATSQVIRAASADCTLSHVEIMDNSTALHGIAISGDRTVVKDCTFDGCSTAFDIRGGEGVKIHHNDIRNWTQRGIYIVGTETTRCDSLEIIGNVVTNLQPGGSSRYPIRIEGNDHNRHRNVRVIGNTTIGPGTSYTDTATPGTADQISITRCDGLHVLNNTSIDGGDGGMTVAQQVSNAIIQGNIIRGADSAGLFLGSVQAAWMRAITVADNVITDCGRNKGGDRSNPAGIVAQQLEHAHFDGNIFGNTDGGIMPTGIRVTDTCSNVTIGPNTNAGLTVALLLVAPGAQDVHIDLPATRARKAADTVRNNTDVRTDDPDLTVPVEPNALYEVSGVLAYKSATDADLSLSFSMPADSTLDWGTFAAANNTTSGNAQIGVGRTATSGFRNVGGTGAPTATAAIDGVLATGDDGGNLTLQWAQMTATVDDTIVTANSWIKLTRIR